jgi:hypothetical protein
LIEHLQEFSVHVLVHDFGDLGFGIVIPPVRDALAGVFDPLIGDSDAKLETFQAFPPEEIRGLGALEPFGRRLNGHLDSCEDHLKPTTLLVSVVHAGKPDWHPLGLD